MELDLSGNALAEADLSPILRACYNHNSYPIRDSVKVPRTEVGFALDIIHILSETRVVILVQ